MLNAIVNRYSDTSRSQSRQHQASRHMAWCYPTLRGDVYHVTYTVPWWLAQVSGSKSSLCNQKALGPHRFSISSGLLDWHLNTQSNMGLCGVEKSSTPVIKYVHTKQLAGQGSTYGQTARIHDQIRTEPSTTHSC